MNQTGKSELDNFWDAMTREIRGYRYVLATLLIHIMREKLSDKDESDDKLVFGELLEAAYSVGEINPFEDVGSFRKVYNASKRLKETDWTGAFERELNLKKEVALSPALVDLYFERFAKLSETVLVAEAEKFIPGLQKYVADNPGSKFVLTSRDVLYFQAITYAFKNYENVEVVLTDIYIPDFTDRKFDLIVSFPILGAKSIGNSDEFICREMDLIALQNLSRHLNGDGRLITLHQVRITYSLGRVAELRKHIQENYTIKEMAQLPEGTMATTPIKLFMLDIVKQTPGEQDTLVRRYAGERSKGRKGLVDILSVKDETNVKYGAIVEQGDWIIDKMFPMCDSAYGEYIKSGVPVKKLEEVADVLRGMTVAQSQKYINGNIATVSISNIGDWDIDYGNMERIREDEKKVSRFLLEEGDVLISARGTAIRSAVFHKQTYPCIATSNVMAIRPDKEKLDSTYLKIFIDSPAGKEMISSIQQSGVIINISYKEVMALEIPVPDLSEQQRRVKEYNEALDKYQKAISDAQNEWKEVLDRVQKFK